ncbi:MAG TPA: M14 family metallopeptidase [Longimicrobiaceae bacterium]|nr:M14 family metallopeptidase [Longimicrobiaceae bacterium]
MPVFRSLLRPALALASGVSLAVLPARTAAQHLPRPPEGGCRSEMNARLAFGLCPDSTFDFYATGSYRAGIPRPEEVLGYPIGSWHTPYGRMERFVEALARSAPDRVKVFEYGESVERQTMYLIAISSERNAGRLEEIRGELQHLADPRGTDEAEARALAGRLPVAVWINAANDGNETAAFEAAIQIAYQLAAGEDPRTRALREGALVLINLAHNPESHERHVAWYNSFVMGDPDPQALEHQAPWGMSTNNNHYQFDLNRDALGLVQTESRAVAAELQRWRPQVFVDLHGQTVQYFFPPAADPVNPVYPEQTTRWLEVFGRGNAAAFDRFGWSYFTRDVFDLFYPGYWDSYPSLHGATGMTYETDGGGNKGVRWRRDDGTILTFADGIAHHFVASLATIETAVAHREARLRDFHQYFASALAEGGRGPLRTVVLLPGTDPERAARLATTLLRHGIEVRRVTRPGSLPGTDYLSGRRVQREIPAGAYLVDLRQPGSRLARTLLAPESPLPESFVRQELARMARNLRRAENEKEEYAFYDVTAWSLPLAMGVPALWSGDAGNLSTESLSLPEAAARAPGGWEGDVAWPRAGGVTGRAGSAYLWSPGSLGATRLLARLLDEGFNVAVAQRELGVDSVGFPRGSYVVRVERNRPELHARIDALAREAGVRVTAVQTAFQTGVPVGTGSGSVRTLRSPRVAVLAGEGVSPTSYGALWFHLERQLGQPFTALRATELDRFRLDDFDVLVLPDGRYSRSLRREAVERIRDWVRRGGTLVGYAAGAEFLQEQELGTEREAVREASLPADSAAALARRAEERAPEGTDLPPEMSPGARPDAPIALSGAFLRARLDPTHWLTFGYEDDELAVLAQYLPLRASTGGANPVMYAGGDRLVISGFTFPDNTRRAYAGRPYATVDGVGAGRVILFAEDPLFRGVFDAPAGLLANAIYLGARAR